MNAKCLFQFNWLVILFMYGHFLADNQRHLFCLGMQLQMLFLKSILNYFMDDINL